MKKTIFFILLLLAALSASFFLGGIVDLSYSYLGLGMTVVGAIILVIGYILGSKKNDTEE